MLRKLKDVYWIGFAFLLNMTVFAQEDTQRYIGLQLLNLEPKPDAGIDIIANSIDHGCNLVALTIAWDNVYPTPNGTPDWRQPDNQIEYLVKRNTKFAIRILVGRLNYKLDGFWTDKETMKDNLGRPLIGVYSRTSFSFAHQPTVAKAQNFIKEVCQRYAKYQAEGRILYVSFVNTPTQELAYHYDTWLDGDHKKAYATGYDYSDWSIDAFRDWLKQRYKTVNKLNYIWRTKFATWQDVQPPPAAYDHLKTYQSRGGKDWYLFNHTLLKNYIDQSIDAVKQVNASYKVVNEYGAVTDVVAAVRNTVAFNHLDQKANGTKVHDDLYWNHRWVTDVVRSNSPNRWVMNEVFFDTGIPDIECVRHFDECFEHGCKIVTMVVSEIKPRPFAIFQQVANKWKNIPLTPVVPTDKMSYKITEVLDSTARRFEKQWEQKSSKSQFQPIEVKIVEDILSDDYWKPLTVNIHPIVQTPLTDRAGKPRKTFTYTLPKNTFADPDGEITKIEVVEKPAWVNYNEGVFSGTIPEQLGDYKITLKATDDEGASVQTTFLFKVVNINMKPVIKYQIPDLAGKIGELVQVQFPSPLFEDPDGIIARTEVRGLRSWMTYSPAHFAAFATEHGIYNVAIRGYDDDSVYTEMTFKYKVINQPPIVKQLLPEKVTAQNKAFKFRISKNIFSDPDGDIARLKALNLPQWLTFDAATNELRGLPTQLGTYQIAIRAYDTAGDSIQTPFTITVDEKGNLNQPPIARYQLPDNQLLISQKFNLKVPDSLFYDTNGYIDRIEIPNLPTWLSFKNSTLSGTATQSGKFAVTLRAIDDDESATAITFTITVRPAQIEFQLMQAGKIIERKLLGVLQDGAILKEANLPPRITIYAFCELPAKTVTYTLSGPYNKTYTAKQFPFSLFDEEKGFEPVAGTYTLSAKAYSDSVVVSQSTIKFKIEGMKNIEDWQVYPNPFVNSINLKLPISVATSAVSFRLVALTGQVYPVAPLYVYFQDQVAYLNCTSLGLANGLYILQVVENGQILQTLKVLKI